MAHPASPVGTPKHLKCFDYDVLKIWIVTKCHWLKMTHIVGHSDYCKIYFTYVAEQASGPGS